MLRESIKQLASTLDPEKFVRIHRSVIVNVKIMWVRSSAKGRAKDPSF